VGPLGHGVGFWAFWLDEMNIYARQNDVIFILIDFVTHVQNDTVLVTYFNRVESSYNQLNFFYLFLTSNLIVVINEFELSTFCYTLIGS
jgi:hypothetical protein